MKIMKLSTKPNLKIGLTSLSIMLASTSYVEASTQRQCSDNLNELRRAMLVMLDRIPIMPPIAQIYRPISSLKNEAEQSEKVGDFTSCVSISELALKYTKPYAR